MSKRQIVSSGAVWEPLVGYSRAVRVGSWVSVAGTTAAGADGAPVGGDDIAEQTREAIRRIARRSTWTTGRCPRREDDNRIISPTTRRIVERELVEDTRASGTGSIARGSLPL